MGAAALDANQTGANNTAVGVSHVYKVVQVVQIHFGLSSRSKRNLC